MSKRFMVCVASLVVLFFLLVVGCWWHPPSELLLPNSEVKTTTLPLSVLEGTTTTTTVDDHDNKQPDKPTNHKTSNSNSSTISSTISRDSDVVNSTISTSHSNQVPTTTMTNELKTISVVGSTDNNKGVHFTIHTSQNNSNVSLMPTTIPTYPPPQQEPLSVLGSNDSDKGSNFTIHDNSDSSTTPPTTTPTGPKYPQPPQQEPFCRWSYPIQKDETLRNQEIRKSSCYQWLNQVHYHPQQQRANVKNNGPTTTDTTTAPSSSSSSSAASRNQNNSKNLRYWYFMGDSTMGQMFTQLVHLFHPTTTTNNNLVFGKNNNVSYTAQTIKESHAHCDLVSGYYKLPRCTTPLLTKNWTYPNHDIFEGPITIGPGKEYCMDCQGCYHHQVRLTKTSKTTTRRRTRTRTTTTSRRVSSNDATHEEDDNDFYMENLVVEFPLDVESPTVTTRTTQETVVLYIQQQHEQRRQERQRKRKNSAEQAKKTRGRTTEQERDDKDSHDKKYDDNKDDDDDDDKQYDDNDDDLTTATVCVINTGIHSQIFRTMPTEPYVDQVLDFLSLLQSTVCGTMIWISTSATLNGERFPQRNDRLEQWNYALEQAIVTQQPPPRKYLPSSMSSSSKSSNQQQSTSFSSSSSGSTTSSTTQQNTKKFKEEEDDSPLLHVWGLDIWNVSLVQPHNDNVHMTRPYYAALGNVFAQLITSGR
jgi:hypothetical protein